MNELKDRILEHANGELRKEENKRKVKEKEMERKERELRIAAERRQAATERGEDAENLD